MTINGNVTILNPALYGSEPVAQLNRGSHTGFATGR